MFMTPREIMENYSFQDAARNIIATDTGNLGTISVEPDHLENLPQKFGQPAPFDDPRKPAEENAEGLRAAKAKFDRGEGNDPDSGDYSYEPGDYTPGTREHNEWQGYTNPDFTDRENYLDQWMDRGQVEGIKREMVDEGFTGDIDQYLDMEKQDHDRRMGAAQEYRLEDVTDRSTWFEDDKQVMDRALVDAQSPTNEVLLAQEYLENPDSDIAGFGTPFGAGAYERVAGVGVERPIRLGTNLEVNVRGDIKRPILGGMDDLVSAHKQKPDALIPVEHHSARWRSGSYANEGFTFEEEQNGPDYNPHAERQEGAEEFIKLEQSRINIDSHMEAMAGRLVDDETLEKEFYNTRPTSASQLEAFGNKP